MLSRPTGVGVYLRHLLHALAAADSQNRYLLFSSSLRERFDGNALPPFRNSSFKDYRIPVRVLNFCWHRLGTPPLDLLFGEPVNLTHSPHPLLLPARRARTIVTIHDLFFLSHPSLVDREMASHYPALVRKHAQRADGIITVSEFSRQEIVSRLGASPDKVAVIHHGPPERAECAPAARDSILLVGRIEYRKNVDNLLRAFARIKSRDCRLRLVGAPGAGYHHSRSLCETLGLSGRVDWVGYQSGAGLAAEYTRARVLAFPSICEGFGLPLLDAMQYAIPIAASNATAIPEVAGDAALYFDPADPDAMAHALWTAWDDETARQRLVEAGRKRLDMFSWERAARQTLDFYETVARRR
ncbi:MAG: glycosyltransferase family 1 protein [Acidobacteriota bacterium]